MKKDAYYYVIIGRNERESVSCWVPIAANSKLDYHPTGRSDDSKNLKSHRDWLANQKVADTPQNPLNDEAAA